MNKLLTLLVKPLMLMTLLLQNSCSDRDEVLEPGFHLLDDQDYFPLHLNNYWELAHLPMRSIEIIETIGNQSYYGMVSERDTTYYRKTPDGKVYARKKATEEILKFDLSAAEGQTWTYEDRSGYIWHVLLWSKNDTVTVGNHTFPNCYRFYFDIPQIADDEKTIWLAPGIGFIEEYYSGGTADRKVLTKVRIDGVDIQL